MTGLEHVSIAFGDKKVLDDVTLRLKEGETLVIMGASGSGKSTILRLLIGLIRPQEGRVIVQDTDITDMDEDELNKVRRHMGMVFQYSALFDSMTVGENVAFGLRQHTEESEEEIQRIVKRNLALVGLRGIEAMMPNDLSGGMKKRVSLARAMALNPAVMLYDEPTAGLDPIRANTISRLIVNTQRHLHCTSVVVTHDMESAFFVADRIAMLHEGKILAVGTPEEIRDFDNEIVQKFIRGGRQTGRDYGRRN